MIGKLRDVIYVQLTILVVKIDFIYPTLFTLYSKTKNGIAF